MHGTCLRSFTLLMTVVSPSISAAQTIVVDQPLVVARALNQRALYEPQLALNPTNPNHMLAIAMVAGSGNTVQDRIKAQTCASFVSMDAGRSWNRHDFAVTTCFDPWVVFTPTGAAVVSMLGVHSTARPGDSNLLVFRSDDGGRTWDDNPVALGRGHDHPVLVIDTNGSSRSGWIYVSSHRGTRADDGTMRWGPWIARSRDGGKTFDDAVTVVPNNLHNLAEMPTVLSDGTLIASFVDASHQSSDKPNGVGFERRRAWIVRSRDGGHTFSIPFFVNDACGPPPGFRLSALAVDQSTTALRDRLYFACREKGAGPIVVNFSADGGEVWSDPIAVSAQPDARPERIPGLAVNNRGVLLVAWIDAGTGAGHKCEEQVFVAASTDGGRTFSAPRTVSNVSGCDDAASVPSSTGGDYFGLVAMPDGRFRLLWSETPSGASQLVTSTIDVR